MAADQDAKKKDAKPKGKGKDEPVQDLSEEDQELKKNLELMVERVSDPDAGVQKLALQSITKEIKTATSSMTSVPKPLKFLLAHTEALKASFEKLTNAESRSLLADIISVMATTTAPKEGVRDALKYKLLGSQDDLGVWGHEYLRHLAGEISEEFSARQEGGAGVDDLMTLVQQIVPFHMTHNAEPEAVDLLLEVERLDLLAQHVDEKNYGRTCLYLVSCCHYLPEPEDTAVLECAHAIYLKLAKWHDAMRIALHLNRRETIEATFAACPDLLARKQLCYLLARQGVPLNLEEGPCAVEDDEAREALREIISNSKLSEHYLTLARDLDVMEAKLPEDVYKSHLTEGRAPQGAAVDSARQNLASSFVNAFVNAGFGHDKLVTASSEGAGDGQVRRRGRWAPGAGWAACPACLPGRLGLRCCRLRCCWAPAARPCRCSTWRGGPGRAA
jgi:26S proteasome regulatory subunit N1